MVLGNVQLYADAPITGAIAYPTLAEPVQTVAGPEMAPGMAGAAASVSILSELEPQELLDLTYRPVSPFQLFGNVTVTLKVLAETVTGVG